ncbi:MAG: DUF4405 domain-containing protein [Lawsonibacter sp.]|nr:DUF4405 domain-containing protein [Lawsonibacter sp.]
MNKKRELRISVDIAMTILLLVLMAYYITGNLLHEWLGAALYLLFILHHMLNLPWYWALLKGRYRAVRTAHTILNFLLLASMLGLMTSSVMISRNVFGFLGIRASEFGRRLHMASAAWGFVLMSAHLGLHWGVAASRVNISPHICRMIAIALSTYGFFAFLSQQVGAKMFLLVKHTIFNGETALLFFVDHCSIMVLFVYFAYYSMKLNR